MEGELKRIQADIEQVKRSHKSELDKTNSEMGEVIQRLGKREEVISKLEKDKREVAVARDKALKQIEDIDKAGLPDELYPSKGDDEADRRVVQVCLGAATA